MIKALATTILSLSICSCVVMRSEGDQIQKDLERLKNEVARLQRDQSDWQQTAFKKNARSGVEQEKLLAEVQQLRGQLEETQYKMQELQAAPKVVEPVVEKPLTKGELFAKAKQLYQQKKYDEAIDVFDGFIEQYKDDKELAVQAYFMRGDAYLNAKVYKKAVLSFQEILTRFPDDKKIPEVLLKTGQCLEAMKYPKDAIVFYAEIMQKHAKSPFAKDAESRLNSLKKSAKKKKL